MAGDQHGRTTSRLTFAGTEDLGGGLKATFNYETRIAPDNTTTPGLDRTRNMFLNLSGGFGSVTIGTYLNPIDTLRGFSAGTYSAPGGDFLANHQGVFNTLSTLTGVTDAALATELGLTTAQVGSLKTLLSNGLSARSTNSIGYRSPSFGGLSFSAGVSNDKNETSVGGTNTATANTKGFIGSVTYADGPLNALLVVGQGQADLVGTGLSLSSSKAKDTGLAASYNLGFAVPYVQHERTSANVGTFNGLSNNTELKTNATEFGSKFPMGAFTPYVTLGSGKIEFDGDEIKTKSFQLGTTYDLSKRTYLYAAAGSFKLSDDSGFSAKTTGYKAGLVHSF